MSDLTLLHDSLHALTGAPREYDALVAELGRARFVLIGEASHGTHEFYAERALLTERLIEEHGFTGVAVEGDWPEAHRVHRYVRGWGEDGEAVDALGDFNRFPGWMWRNADVLDFVGWLRDHNEHRKGQVGFYGLDLYSLHRSISAVIEYLDSVDREAAARARTYYSCFDHFGADPTHYGLVTARGAAPSCEDACLRELADLHAQRSRIAGGGGRPADEHFYAVQNARVAAGAEAYYRGMFRMRVNTWNLRDTHMADTLDALAAHLGPESRIVVWAHNSHVGDARAARKSLRGDLTLGQLVRERHGADVRTLGFTTYQGTVTAASDWGQPPERKRVRPGRADSWEGLFHKLGVPSFWLDLREAPPSMHQSRLERAIGVVYLPQSERTSHYFESELASRFDFVVHVDETRAVEPLERDSRWEEGEFPDTWPTSL